jgi:hypothetical protein
VEERLKQMIGEYASVFIGQLAFKGVVRKVESGVLDLEGDEDWIISIHNIGLVVKGEYTAAVVMPPPRVVELGS